MAGTLTTTLLIRLFQKDATDKHTNSIVETIEPEKKYALDESFLRCSLGAVFYVKMAAGVIRLSFHLHNVLDTISNLKLKTRQYGVN